MICWSCEVLANMITTFAETKKTFADVWLRSNFCQFGCQNALDHLYTGIFALWNIRKPTKQTQWPHGISQMSIDPLNAPLTHRDPPGELKTRINAWQIADFCTVCPGSCSWGCHKCMDYLIFLWYFVHAGFLDCMWILSFCLGDKIRSARSCTPSLIFWRSQYFG